jgi:hypothetical protein
MLNKQMARHHSPSKALGLLLLIIECRGPDVARHQKHKACHRLLSKADGWVSSYEKEFKNQM